MPETRAIHVCIDGRVTKIREVPKTCKKCGTRLEAPHLEEKETPR